MEFNHIDLSDKDLSLENNGIKFAKRLKGFLMKSNYALSQPFYEGYSELKKEKGAFLTEDRKLTERDTFKHNTLVTVLEKKSENVGNPNYFNFSEQDLENFIVSLLIDADFLLLGLYGSGQTQSFMYDDGMIFNEYMYEEKDDKLYIYAYYAYIGK